VAAGRRLFAERGFRATSTEDIVRAAGLSRGALYHHFADKTELFGAVLEVVEADLMARLIDRIDISDPARAIREGVPAFLDACLHPEVSRIALLEAPSVLGWQRWREVDARYGLGMVAAGVQAAMDVGDLPRQPVAPLAHTLFGSLTEAAMYMAHADDPVSARTELEPALQALLNGLLTNPEPTQGGRPRRGKGRANS
jgi:AcrR family transcriptional regulator